MRPVPTVASTQPTLSFVTIPRELPIELLAQPRSPGRKQCACHALGRELIPVSYSTSTRRRLRADDIIANISPPFRPLLIITLRALGSGSRECNAELIRRSTTFAKIGSSGPERMGGG